MCARSPPGHAGVFFVFKPSLCGACPSLVLPHSKNYLFLIAFDSMTFVINISFRMTDIKKKNERRNTFLRHSFFHRDNREKKKNPHTHTQRDTKQQRAKARPKAGLFERLSAVWKRQSSKLLRIWYGLLTDGDVITSPICKGSQVGVTPPTWLTAVQKCEASLTHT